MSGHRLLLVGCGKMGRALLAGWLHAGLAERVVAVEPNPAAVPEHPAVLRAADAAAVPASFTPEAVVLAVKPQLMDAVAPAYRRFVGPGTVFLSIAAGRTIGGFAPLLGPDAAIVRAMPNTPSAIGRGIAVLVANATASPEQRALCDGLMRAAGAVAWVDDEALLDPVTALSGGGPAYVFLLIEVLAAAGAACGLPPELALRLARETVIGAGALAAASAEDAAVLRRNVTSPGGTTEAALRVLMAPDGLQPLFDRAIAAATARARELAGPPR